MRTTADLRRALEDAAAKSGRSLAQEAEMRLARSLEDDDTLKVDFARRRLHSILSIAAEAMDHAGAAVAAFSGPSGGRARQWLDDPDAVDQAIQAANTIFDLFRPAGQVTNLPPRLSTAGKEFGRGIIESLLEEQASKWGDVQIPPRSHVELGNLIDRLRTNIEQQPAPSPDDAGDDS